MEKMNEGFNFKERWDSLHEDLDENYLASVMGAIGTLASTLIVGAECETNLIKAVQEYTDIEKALHDDFNKALNCLKADALEISLKQTSDTNDIILAEIDALSEKIRGQFVNIIGTAMVNERRIAKKIPEMFKDIGGAPIRLERIVNASKNLHASITECDDRAKQVISSLGGEDDANKYNTEVIGYVLEASDKYE